MGNVHTSTGSRIKQISSAKPACILSTTWFDSLQNLTEADNILGRRLPPTSNMEITILSGDWCDELVWCHPPQGSIDLIILALLSLMAGLREFMLASPIAIKAQKVPSHQFLHISEVSYRYFRQTKRSLPPEVVLSPFSIYIWLKEEYAKAITNSSVTSSTASGLRLPRR